MSIPFEEIGQSNSRIGLVTACAEKPLACPASHSSTKNYLYLHADRDRHDGVRPLWLSSRCSSQRSRGNSCLFKESPGVTHLVGLGFFVGVGPTEE
jgi:hypothetical protein